MDSVGDDGYRSPPVGLRTRSAGPPEAFHARDGGTLSETETTPQSDRAGRFVRTATRLRPNAELPARRMDEASAGRRVEARDARYRRLLALADVVATTVALFVAVVLVGDERLLAGAVVAVPVALGVARLHGLYDRDELLICKTTLEETPRLLGFATVCTLLLLMLQPVVVAGQLGDAGLASLWVTMFGGALLTRRAARSVARRTTTPERILVVGDPGAYARLRAKLGRDGISAELVGRMAPAGIRGSRPRSGRTRLSELIDELEADRVVIAPSALSGDEMLDFVRAAKAVGVRVSLLPHVLDVVGTSVVLDDVHGLLVMGVRRFDLSRSSRLLKRAFDLGCASLLVLVLAPLLALIAVAIRLDSGGPVLFRQTRVGHRGRHFRIAKFRTMCSDAEARKDELRDRNEAVGLFKIAEDPRVTRVGRVLRRTSLDELPQLFNVVAGDMSLVGPRPLVVDEDEQITGADRRRLHLTPGMTGHWQILGSARVPLPEMVKIDYFYVSTWTLWTDLKILLRTVPHVLQRRGM